MREYTHTTRSRSLTPTGRTRTTVRTTTHSVEERPTFSSTKVYKTKKVPAGYSKTKTYTTSSRLVPTSLSRTYRYESSPGKVIYNYETSSTPVQSKAVQYHYESTHGLSKERTDTDRMLSSTKSGRYYYDAVSSLDRNDNTHLGRLAKLSQYESDPVRFPANYDYGAYGPSYTPQRRVRTPWKYDYHTNSSNYRNRRVDSSLTRLGDGDRSLPSYKRYVIYDVGFTYLSLYVKILRQKFGHFWFWILVDRQKCKFLNFLF